jgi:hypothetical protein
MAKRSLSHRSITPTATADTTNLVDSTYPFAIQGGTATQQLRISEVFFGGQAAASAPTLLVAGRDSTVGATLTADATMNDAAIDPATAALAAAPATFNKATTKPQRSVTLGCLLNLSFNAFGGIVRWVAPDKTGEVVVLGNTASLGEVSFSAFSGGTPGLLGGHCIYETLALWLTVGLSAFIALGLMA